MGQMISLILSPCFMECRLLFSPSLCYRENMDWWRKAISVNAEPSADFFTYVLWSGDLGEVPALPGNSQFSIAQPPPHPSSCSLPWSYSPEDTLGKQTSVWSTSCITLKENLTNRSGKAVKGSLLSGLLPRRGL